MSPIVRTSREPPPVHGACCAHRVSGMSALKPSSPEFAAQLGAFLRDELEAPALEVSSVRRLSGGASRETFEIVLENASVPRAAMQRVRGGALSSTFSM